MTDVDTVPGPVGFHPGGAVDPNGARDHGTRTGLDAVIGDWKRRVGEILTTPEGKALAKQRQAVERCFSRLKGKRSLNHVSTRGLRKVTAHCYLSLIAMQASALRQ